MKSCIEGKARARIMKSKVARILTWWSCRGPQHGTPHGACGVYQPWQNGVLSQHRGKLPQWMPWRLLTYIAQCHRQFPTVPLTHTHAHTFIHSNINMMRRKTFVEEEFGAQGGCRIPKWLQLRADCERWRGGIGSGELKSMCTEKGVGTGRLVTWKRRTISDALSASDMAESAGRGEPVQVRLKCKTSGKLPIILEEPREYTSH